MRLRLVRRPDGIPPGANACAIAPAGVRIGRGADCELVLDDGLRLVSRRHAWLAPHGNEQLLLRCISNNSAIQVNNDLVPPGDERVVQAGDFLRVGGFEVLVEAGDEASGDETVARPLPRAALPRPAPAPAAAALPDPAPAPAAAARPTRLDRWFDLAGAPDPLGPASPLPPAPIHVAPVMAEPPRPAPAPAPVVHSFLGSLQRVGDRRPAGATHPPLPGDEPQHARLFEGLSLVPPAPMPAAVAPPAVDEAEVLRLAFLRGAGLDAGTRLTVDAESMQHIGSLLRALTEGTLDLLRTRALAKRNIRAENTRILKGQNNPLKFAPDAAEALPLMVTRQSWSGFLEPVAAVRDAHKDLQVHQVAMMAGMRAAVFELVSRLGPEATELAEGPAQGLAQSIPALRDAALWRRHQMDHEHLLANLDEVLDMAFGREFLKAYEAQAKLATTPPQAPG